MAGIVKRLGLREKAAEVAVIARRYAEAGTHGAGWRRMVEALPADGDPEGVLAAYRIGFPGNMFHNPLLTACECCGATASPLVRVDTAHTGEYGPSDFCEPCVRRMAAVFAAQPGVDPGVAGPAVERHPARPNPHPPKSVGTSRIYEKSTGRPLRLRFSDIYYLSRWRRAAAKERRRWRRR